MSGLFRNLLTFLFAWLLASRSSSPWAPLRCRFLVTPLECGTRVLKSDKYLQLVEAAQVDFLIRNRLFGRLFRNGWSFINVSILVRYMKPVAMFRRVCIESSVVFADERCAYLSHVFMMDGKVHGQVLVKMKFKEGRITVNPGDVLGECPRSRPPYIDAWDKTLDQINGP